MKFSDLAGMFTRSGKPGGRTSVSAVTHTGSRRMVVEPLEERQLLSAGYTFSTQSFLGADTSGFLDLDRQFAEAMHGVRR